MPMAWSASVRFLGVPGLLSPDTGAHLFVGAHPVIFGFPNESLDHWCMDITKRDNNIILE